MKYVTIPMLVSHTKKHRSSIIRAMRVAGVAGEKFPGVKGIRIALADANRVLALHWPNIPPMTKTGLYDMEGR